MSFPFLFSPSLHPFFLSGPCNFFSLLCSFHHHPSQWGCRLQRKKKRKKEKTGLHVERNPTFSYWNTKPTAVKCSSKTQTTATHIFLTFILSGESMCALCLTHCCTHLQWDLPPAASGVCCWSMNRSPAACAFLQSIKTCSTFKFFQSRELVHKTDYPWQIKMFLGVNPGHE